MLKKTTLERLPISPRTESVKQYLRLEGCDAEDSLIEAQIKTAFRLAESYTNRILTPQRMLITTDDTDVVIGIELDEVIYVKYNGEVTEAYEITQGQNAEFKGLAGEGKYEMELTSKEVSDPLLDAFINKAVLKLFERDVLEHADYKAINSLRNIVWLV